MGTTFYYEQKMSVYQTYEDSGTYLLRTGFGEMNLVAQHRP